MHSFPSFPAGSRSTAKLGLALLLAVFAAMPSGRAQGVPPTNLQLSVGAGICPEGWDWQLCLQAHIENRRFYGFEPVILSLDSQLPLLGGADYVRGPLWGGYGSDSVTAYSAAAIPGTYNVTARASTAEWMLEFADQPWMIDWVTSILGTDLLEETVTKTVTVVGLTGVTTPSQHVAIGDTVTLTATMTPIAAFEWVWWDWAPGAWWPFMGQTYSPTMNGYGRDANGVVALTATCGNNTLTVPITVYQITGLSASADLVAAGDSLTFTATIDPPGGTPPPIEWFVDGISRGYAPASSPFNATALPPGHHTVSAKLGTSEHYAWATVVGIGSVTLSGPDTAGAIAPIGTQYIYQGDTYTFTATAAPDGAVWPPNQPTWTIADNPTAGPTASNTFTSVSSSITNFATAVVRCGTSSNTTMLLIFSASLTVDPETNFVGRSLSSFGLGEVLTVTNNLLPAGLSPATLNLDFAARFPFPAQLVPAPDKKTAKLSGVAIAETYRVDLVRMNNVPSSPIARVLNTAYPNFIAPTFMEYVPVIPGQGGAAPNPVISTLGWGITNLPVNYICHNSNSATAGAWFEVIIHPGIVSWHKIQVREGACPYFDEGCYANVAPHPEWPQFVTPVLAVYGPNPPIVGSLPSVYGWALPGTDQSAPPNIPPTVTNPDGTVSFGGGGRFWANIPLEYIVPSAVIPFNDTKFALGSGSVYFEASITDDGVITVRKQATTWQTRYGSPNSP